MTHDDAPDWHPAPTEVRAACKKAAQLCRSRGSHLSKIALQWATQDARLASVLVGMNEVSTLESNVGWLHEALDEALLAEVRAVLAQVHGWLWSSGRPENQDAVGSPFHLPRLWR